MPFSDQSFPYFFPVFFVGFWLLIATVLGFISGWFELQQHYPRGDEPALLTLRGRSGSMGWGVSLSGILTLSACPSGLRVGIWRMFGPFQRPFLVPWNEIDPVQTNRFFIPSTKLKFGNPTIGSLRINARTWQKLARASPDAPTTGKPPITRAQAGRSILVQWAAMTSTRRLLFIFHLQCRPKA